MDLKMPKEWLEDPDDAEDTEDDSITQRTASTEGSQQPDEPYEPAFEDYEYSYEMDSDLAADVEPDLVDENGIVILELLVPHVERSVLERQPRNRHRRYDRIRRSRRLRRSARRSSRARTRSRSRQRSRSEPHVGRPEADNMLGGLFSLRPTGRPSYHNRYATSRSRSGSREAVNNSSRQHPSTSS